VESNYGLLVILRCVSMRAMKHLLKVGFLLALSVSFLAAPLPRATAEDEYSFKVTNTTEDKITKLLASEDGETYGNFELSKKGIPPGKTVTLTWDKSTNNKGCKWYLKAVFEDGSESPAKRFDFCEADLEIEF
jgi:hypothetical protein